MSLQFLAPLDRQQIVYINFYAAFHPGSSVKKDFNAKFIDALLFSCKDKHEPELQAEPDIQFIEDEIYPGIKRPETMNEKKKKKNADFITLGLTVIPPNDLSSSSKGSRRRGRFAKGNMPVEEKERINRRQSWDSEWEATWQEYNLEIDFMDTLLRYLKIQDKSEYIPLNDMSMETYNLLRDVWTHNRIKFMQGQFWVNGILGFDETVRRLRTMSGQISEITRVEDWKIIKKSLIANSKLEPQEAEQIERHLKLLIKFPNPKLISLSKTVSSRILTDVQRNIFPTIKKSLGINGPRPIPIRPRENEEFPELYNAISDLCLLSRTKGVDIDRIFWARSLYESYPTTATEILEEVTSDEMVPWKISAEKSWLNEVYKHPGC
jgi:hypothetical protein